MSTTSTFVYPMKPSSFFPASFKLSDYYFEPKYDGWRIIYDGSCFWSRRGKVLPWAALEKFAVYTDGLLLDGELVCVDGRARITSNKDNPEKYKIYWFDVIIPDVSIEKRREILQNLLQENNQLDRLIYRFEAADESYFLTLLNMLCQNRERDQIEGIVFKRRRSKYMISEGCSVITGDWIKLKF